MSYDIIFKVKVEGIDQYVPVGDFYANIAWNAREIVELSTGLEWKNGENNGYVKDVIVYIENGLNELRNHPEKYKPYEAKNGWGTVERTIDCFERILEYWHSFCEWEDEDFVNAATFWIE